MRYIKLFESYNDIEYICDYYDIRNYIINEDNYVSVDGDVNFSNKNLDKLPLKFGKVNGGFNCRHNNLITLEGSPEYVSNDFYCGNNKLTTLVGGPKYVGGYFSCGNNELTSLKGNPEYVGKSYYCSGNKISSLKGITKEIGMDIYLSPNPLPAEIFNNLYCLKKIIKYQDEYGIWNINGTLNKERFNLMMQEIEYGKS